MYGAAQQEEVVDRALRAGAAHLDLRAVADHATELRRLLDLGARPMEHEWGELPWSVLVDPAGNEFCLL